MKIFYPLLCYYPSEAGGPANTVYWLSKALGKNGYYSYVVSTRFGLKSKEIDKKAIYDKFNIDTEFVTNSIFSFFTRKQIRKLKKSKIIHFSSLFFKPTLFYLILGLLFSKKIVISPRGELYPDALQRKKRQKQCYLKVISLFQKKINFHATNSVEGHYVDKYFPKANSIKEIPNYIEIPTKLSHNIKKQLLYLGRINPIKNIDILIKAFAKLPDYIISDFTLIIAGEAVLNYEKEYEIQIRKLITKLNLPHKIKLIGGVYGKNKEKLLSESYCLVLPSKSENFGNVALEALCQGTPAIITKNAPWEIIKNHNAGFWVTINVQNLTKALEQVISLQEAEYMQVRRNALNLAISHFDLSKNVNKWIEFYQDI